MNAIHRKPRGTVLLVAMVAIVVALTVALSMLQTTVANSKSQDQATVDNTASVSTHAATEFVMSDLWAGFNGQLPASNPAYPNFFNYLNSKLTFTTVSNGSADSVAEDFRSGPNSYTSGANGVAPVLDNPTKVYRALVTSYNNIRFGDRIITGVRVYKKERPVPGQIIADILVVAETQKYTGVTAAAQAITVSNSTPTDVTVNFAPQWEAQLFKVSSPPDFNGFDYALLTKNLTCTCCHFRARNRALVDNLNGYKYWNSALSPNPASPATKAGNVAMYQSQWDNIDRVKVGITEYLGVRSGQEYSQIDGTLYTRGQIQFEGNHNNMTPAQVMAEQLDSSLFTSNTSNGAKIDQDNTTGTPTACPFANATTDASGNPIGTPAANGNMYLNYGSTNQSQTDGQLPANNFPAAFPEIPKTVTLSTGNITAPNGAVDADEVTAMKTGMVASTDPTKPSTLTGGSAVTLAAGTNYTNPSLPAGAAVTTSAGNVTPAAANISQSYTGNVVITGTIANPIKIDGKVVIDGDVVIRGYVQGTGQIYASGNIYIPGDVIYNNDNVGTVAETFGTKTNPDGTKTTNLLMMAAGKNVVVGDYLSQVTHWDSNNADFYTGFNYNSSTKKVTPVTGQPEPGMKQSFSPIANSYINPNQMDIAPTITLPAGADLTALASGSLTKSPTGANWGGTNFANFTVEQFAYFNRNELMKVMPKLPSGDPTLASSYTTSAANNPSYDPNYVPKFYSMYKYNPAAPATTPPLAFIYNGSTYTYDSSAANNSHWNGTDDPHVYDYFTSIDNMPAGSISTAAKEGRTIINIHPEWIPPATMMRIISDEQDKHVPVIADPQYGAATSSLSTAYQIPDRRLDGVMYTNNAIFCVERKQSNYYNPATGTWSKVAAKSGGYMQVNGALIAPDTGILVTGNAANNFTNDSSNRQAFLINYDARVKAFNSNSNQDFSNNPVKAWGIKRRGLVMTRSTMPLAP